MRPRNTLAAFGVLLALAGVIYLEYRADTEPGPPGVSGSRLLEPAAEGDRIVSGLDLIRPEGAVSVRRSGQQWALTSPLEAPADEGAVKGVVATLESLEIEESLAPEGPLAAYGLDPPRLEIAIHLQGRDHPVRLHVGGKVPVRSALYAKRAGEEEILMVSSSVESLLEKEAEDLRYRELVGMESWEVHRLAVERRGARVELERHGSGWRLLSPERLPAVGERVNEALFGITALRAEGFAPAEAEEEELGLDTPEIVLQVAGESGRERTIRMSRADGGDGWWASRSDMDGIFRLPGPAGEALRLDPVHLRDPRIVPLDGHTLREIIAGLDGSEIALVRGEDSAWRWAGAPGAPVEQEQVEELISALEDSRARQLVPPGGAAAASGEEPRLRLRLKAAGAEPLRVELAGCDGESCKVSSSATNQVYVLPAAQADRLVEVIRSMEPPEAATAGETDPPEGDPAS